MVVLVLILCCAMWLLIVGILSCVLLGKKEPILLLFIGLWCVCVCGLSWLVYSSSWCHWQATFCDCGASWSSLQLLIEKRQLREYIQVCVVRIPGELCNCAVVLGINLCLAE